jgi:hypothetical protein
VNVFPGPAHWTLASSLYKNSEFVSASRALADGRLRRLQAYGSAPAMGPIQQQQLKAYLARRLVMRADKTSLTQEFVDRRVCNCCLTASRTQRTTGDSRPMCLECSNQTFCITKKSFALTNFIRLRKTEE